MPGTTFPLGLPYPLPGDPPPFEKYVQDLAEAADALYLSTLAQLQAALSPPAGHATGGTQILPTGIMTPLLFNAEYYDNDNMVDVVAAPYVVTVKTAGVYSLMARMEFSPDLSGHRQFELYHNATLLGSWTSDTPDSVIAGFSAPITELRAAVPGDTFSIKGGHTASTSISCVTCELAAYRVHP